MKDKILALLKSADGFLSGEAVSTQLGISRSAVWKHINHLRKEGYQITSAQNKGYRLVSTADILNEKELREALDTSLLGNHIICLDEVDSTNNELKRHAGLPDGTLAIADIQSAGKGRRGNPWTSEPGAGIWMSLLLKPEIDMQDISQVTLVAGMGVCRALRESAGVNAQIKWPNDIVCEGKKICGILTELAAEIDHVEYLVCGIGINVNQTSFPSDISRKAASLYLLTGSCHKRIPLVQAVLRHIETVYLDFCRNGFSKLRADYRSMCVTLGREVKIIRPNGEQTAFARDISEQGELICEQAGNLFTVSSGEVSVRGIYDYI